MVTIIQLIIIFLKSLLFFFFLLNLYSYLINPIETNKIKNDLQLHVPGILKNNNILSIKKGKRIQSCI